MVATPVTVEDVGRVAALLRRRRDALLSYAPVFWRPAPDADARHRAYLEHLLTDGGALAWRTTSSVLVATRRGDGWLVDDLHVEAWTSDGVELWSAFAASCTGDDVRFVVPTYETARARHAAAAGLTVVESWWLLEMPSSGGGEAGVQVPLPGSKAVTVASPPVYAPPGPMLFLPSVTDVHALPVALDRAPALGCAGVVVNQRAGEDTVGPALADCGLRRHCDFLEGAVRSM